MFLQVLVAYPMEEIKAAFCQWMTRNQVMPTPAGIVNIIDPQPEPLSGAVYVQIQKRMRDGNIYIPPWDREYCAAYERQEHAKIRGGTSELRQAKAEVEDYGRKLMIEYSRSDYD